MGFLDRFKKKEEDHIKKENKPLELHYSNGTVADISFYGIRNVNGKELHSVMAVYTKANGEFTSKRLLLEPITKEDNGKVVDATEEYYKHMAVTDGTQETMKRYSAVKGFFKDEAINDNIVGSNYIGNLAQNEKGEYYRHYDMQFRDMYVKEYRQNEQERISTNNEMHLKMNDEFQKDLMDKVDNTPVHYKESHAEHLTIEKSPFKDR